MNQAPKGPYSGTFFDYLEKGSTDSARTVVPLLTQLLRPTSVLDVGCGRGAWLSAWLAAGVNDIVGLDGDYVEPSSLLIPSDTFRPTDLKVPFNLNRRFSVVQSLEVAEHLPPSAAKGFVASLCQHGDVVVFSAAVPGQGGESHINERPLDFWRSLFAEHGFVPFDAVRPKVRDDASVEPWYRYNLVVYAKEGAVDAIADTRVPDTTSLARGLPLSWQVRLAVLGRLPVSAVSLLARLKHRLLLLVR